MPSSSPSAPDDAPSRRDIALSIVNTGWILLVLALAETVFWGWLIAGFVVTVVGTGPLAASPTGVRIGAWFRSIGYAGRAIAICTSVVGVWTVLATLPIPTGLVISLAAGGMVGVLAVVTLETVQAHGIAVSRSH